MTCFTIVLWAQISLAVAVPSYTKRWQHMRVKSSCSSCRVTDLIKIGFPHSLLSRVKHQEFDDLNFDTVCRTWSWLSTWCQIAAKDLSFKLYYNHIPSLFPPFFLVDVWICTWKCLVAWLRWLQYARTKLNQLMHSRHLQSAVPQIRSSSISFSSVDSKVDQTFNPVQTYKLREKKI